MDALMTMDEAILRRRTFRSYIMESLEPEIIDDLVDFLSDLVLPDNKIEWNFDTPDHAEMARLLGGDPLIDAPHYLLIRSEKVKGVYQNVGYIGEMACLWLTAHGIASGWWGSCEISPVNDYEDVLPYIATVCFGRSAEAFRDPETLPPRKKSLAKVAFGDMREHRQRIMELTWMAPSCMNVEPCRYVVDTHRIHIYRKKSKLLKGGKFESYQCLDVGVAMAHMDVAAHKFGFRVIFEHLYPEPNYRRETYQFSAHLLTE